MAADRHRGRRLRLGRNRRWQECGAIGRAQACGWPLELLVVGAYVVVRVWQAAAATPLYTRDSVDYARIARLPIGGTFASEVKPWGLPLLYKLLPGDLAISVPIAQLLLSIGAWLALAFAVGRCVEHTKLRRLALVCVLTFSCSAAVAQWDAVLLSESLSLSLFALVLAAGFELVRRPRPVALAALLVLAMLWAAARDTNAYAFAPLALALLVSFGWRRKRLAAVLVCGSVLILAASAASASSPRRWQLVMIDLVGERVLASPQETAYFRARGMPLPQDLRRRLYVDRTPLARFERDRELRPFRRWLLRSGRATYASYLLSHRHEAIDRPLRRAGLLLTPVGLDFYKPRGFRELLPRALERIFPASGRNVLVWLALAAAVAAALASAGRGRLALLIPVAIGASALPLAILIWDSEPREVPRHELIPIVSSRLALLALCLLVLDQVPALAKPGLRFRRRAHEAPQPPTVAPPA
jgi:hypothetical protein